MPILSKDKPKNPRQALGGGDGRMGELEVVACLPDDSARVDTQEIWVEDFDSENESSIVSLRDGQTIK